ncbi:xaa-Pro dipeptidase isoform 2 [Corchorus olitorius]|uniref:Xaa-Pro dipeptidase isoform 2 n=1 Tax=Corchorus olitorius TaxID=93759 RepID=A0A1R3KEA1_9ROSI|nr:xaa-Pro dipeptidase isoform 2 [Corchorus olitorius]
MKWKDSTGTAKTATNRLIPEHCSAVNILHHFTDPYAINIAKYNGTIAHITL